MLGKSRASDADKLPMGRKVIPLSEYCHVPGPLTPTTAMPLSAPAVSLEVNKLTLTGVLVLSSGVGAIEGPVGESSVGAAFAKAVTVSTLVLKALTPPVAPTTVRLAVSPELPVLPSHARTKIVTL